MADPNQLERDLRLLEAALHELETQYTMFFAGSIPRPPVETRSRVEALLRRYDRVYIQSYADRFRLATLQNRFSRFCDLWDRGLRAREEGRPGPFQHLRREASAGQVRSEVQVPAPPASPPLPPPPPPAAPVEHAVRVGLGGDEELGDKLQGLHGALVEARRAAGSREDLPFDRFADLVQEQLERLRHAGSREVVFRVATEEGKVVFTAKASGSGAATAAKGAGRSKKEGERREG